MPIEFLFGDEDYLIEKETEKIKKQVLNGDVNELNYRVVDNPSFSTFSETLRTNAMMFGDVVIVVKCPRYFLESKQKEKLDEKQTKELIEGLNNVSQRVHLILICPTPKGEKKKPDSRKKLYKELIKITKPKEFQSYKSYEDYKLIPIIKKMADESELKIGNGEINLLIQTVGTSLRDISNSLEKLKLYAYPKNIITKEMVKEVVCVNCDIFALVDLILNKDYTQSLKLISDILQKEHYLPTLAFIQSTFSNLTKLKIYSKKLRSYDLAVKLNQNEFIVKKNLEKIAKIPLEELIRLKINLTKAEFKLKQGTIKDPICALELAFFENEQIKIS